MNTNLTPENEARLSETLGRWVVDAPLPPRFQEHVWNRIARAETGPQISFWQAVAKLIGDAFARPRVAYGYAAVLLALGIAAGSFSAQLTTNRLETNLGQRYVQSIDPYQKAELGQ